MQVGRQKSVLLECYRVYTCITVAHTDIILRLLWNYIPRYWIMEGLHSVIYFAMYATIQRRLAFFIAQVN